MRAHENLTPDLMRHMLRVCGRSTAQPFADGGADTFRKMARVCAAACEPGDGQRSSPTGGNYDSDGDRRRHLEAKNSTLLSLPQVRLWNSLRVCRRRRRRRIFTRLLWAGLKHRR